MTDPKKLSLAEILAQARANVAKAADGAPATPAAEKPTAEKPAKEKPAKKPAAEEAPPEPVAESGDAAAEKPAAKKPVKAMSMAEMLAAARAEKGGPKPAAKPAAEKPAAKPAAEKPAPKAKPAAAEATPKEAAKDGGPKDTASILAAARKGDRPGPMSKSEAAAKGTPLPDPEAAKKKKLEVPPMPAKPAYAQAAAVAPASAKGAAQVDRRGAVAVFLAATFAGIDANFITGLSLMLVTGVAWVLGFARFMFPNVLIEPPTKFKVGVPDDFAPGQVQTRFIPQFGVWVVRYEFEGQPMIFALKSVCTHLGCTPGWLEGEQKFKCPCHGSGFYKDGVNFEGPAPRPLERYAISRSDDGQLEVDKSRTFQQEMGQWKDPASYVPV